MKTKIIRTALFISLFALSFGCDNSADLSGDLSQDINAKDQETQQVYPVEIQATDFSLPEGCGWKSPAKGEPDIYVIRSVEDILPLIDGEFPESFIDFEKYSLVYARGRCTSGIVDIKKQLQQISGSEYLLNVDITNDMTAVAQTWNIAIQVPVISQDAEIKLDVNAFPKYIALVQIAQGELHGNGKEGFSRESIVIKTDSEWEAFKQKINTTNNVVDAYFTETEIDFSAYQIIAVFDEVKGNGGWSIDITGITEWQDKMLISVTNLKSGKEGGYAVMNQPFQIVKIPVAEKEIIFEYDLDENPLTDLSWLKTKVDEITSLFQGKPVHIAIYQCLYDGGKTGFLEDRGNIAFLYNCEGETLCIKGGDAGETCSELNIVSKVLLWEINNNNGITACGVIDPKKNIPWLAELIAKAETDKTGNYLGVIWLERYKDQDVFVTNMALGSGGLAYHVFDCEGNPATIDNADVQDFFNNLKKDIVIYVNPGDHPLN